MSSPEGPPPPHVASVLVNGEPHVVDPGTSLLTLLEKLSEPIDKAVVEHNGRYVRRADLAVVTVATGDRIEVILPAFGG